MLVSEVVQFKSPPKINIQQILPAYNSTYIVLYGQERRVRQPNKTWKEKYFPFKIQHIDFDKTVINSYPCQKTTKDLIMIKSDELLVPIVQKNIFEVVSLRTKTKRQIPYHFFGYDEYREIFFFPQTNLLCVKSVYSIKQAKKQEQKLKRFSLEYIDLPSGSQILQFNSKNLQEKKQIYLPKAEKGNNNSLILFFKSPDLQIIRDGVVLHSIQTVQGKIQSHIQEIYLRLDSFIKFNYHFWQISAKQLMMVKKNAFIKEFLKVYNLEDGSIEDSGCEERQFIKELGCTFMGKYVYIRAKNRDYYVLYLIHEGKFYPISKGNRQIGWSGYCPTACDYEPEVLVQKFYMNRLERSQRVIVNKSRYVEFKDVYMYFLLGVNEDFDDDLLMDAMELLTELS